VLDEFGFQLDSLCNIHIWPRVHSIPSCANFVCTVIHLYGLHYQQNEFELRMRTWHNVPVNSKLVHVKFGLSGLPSR